MWAHHLVIPLLLLTTVSKCEIDRSPSMLAHYMNLLSIGESWLAINFNMESNGTFFLGNNSEQRLEVGCTNRSLYMVLPISSSRIQHKNLEKRHVIDLDSMEKIGPNLELNIVFQHNHIEVYDGCDEIFAAFEPHLMLSLVHAKVKVVDNWKGPQPSYFAIGSGWPIGQKCRLHGVKKKYAQSYSEEIEKNYLKSMDERVRELFYEEVAIAPLGFQGCKINNALLNINETKISHCNICTCLDKDDIICRGMECPAVTCEHPVTRNGDCCPTCGEQCFHDNHKIPNPHGEVFWPGDCHRCQCWDSEVHCSSEYATCEPPSCPEEDWVYNEKFNCCPKCRDFARFCATNPCDKYASCTDSKRGPKCSCNTGFQGNGTFCEDIDECAFSQDIREQLGGCLAGSICRNIPGSYKCDCLPGYQMIGENTCLPLIRV